MYKQLQYDDRLYIQICLEDPDNNSLQTISLHLHRSRSSIYREIIEKSEITSSQDIILPGSSKGQECPLLTRWPYVCNNCAKAHCPKQKRFYNAYSAEILSKSKKRKSLKLKKESANKIQIVEAKIVPLLKNKISVEVACSKTHSDISPSSIRYWITAQKLSIKRIDMPRAAKFYSKKLYAPKKTKSQVPARVLYSRTIKSFLEYLANTNSNVAQVDTVIGKSSDKYSILTIYETKTKFQFGFRIRNTAEGLNEKILMLWNLFEALGISIGIILTDNGMQMQRLPDIEVNEVGLLRFKTFYCDPYCSSQKSECERNHVIVRYKLKKGESIDNLSAIEVTDIFSEINSYPRKSLNWLSPFEAFVSKFPNGLKLLESLGFKLIPLDKINFRKK